MPDSIVTQFLSRQRIRQAVFIGGGTAAAILLAGEVLLAIFSDLLYVVPHPSLTTALLGLPWVLGIALIVGLVAGGIAWLFYHRRTQPVLAGGSIALPGRVEIALNGITTSEPQRNWAIFADVSNITFGEAGSAELSTGELARALDWLETTHERILIRQAYGDFSAATRSGGALGVELRRHGFTLIHLPRLSQGSEKNHSDIQMAVGAAEFARSRPDIGGFVILGGDSDFLPLILQLRALGKFVQVIGRERTTHASVITHADQFVYLDAIVGRNLVGRNSLKLSLGNIRNALEGLAGKSIAIPVSAFPDLLRTLGVDVTALGFGDPDFFREVMIGLGVLKQASTPIGEMIRAGDVPADKNQLDALMVALSATVEEFDRRRQHPTLSQALDAIFKVSPDLDVTKKTPLLPIQILAIAERLGYVGSERTPNGEKRLVPAKATQPVTSR